MIWGLVHATDLTTFFQPYYLMLLIFSRLFAESRSSIALELSLLTSMCGVFSVTVEALITVKL